MKKKLFSIFIFLFSLCFAFADDGKITTITINNARRTEYKKAEDTGNDSIFLEGSVELSVEKDDKISKIRADKVVYDRKTEMLYAEGNVEIVTTSSEDGQNDVTTAESVLLNTSTMEGVFDDGRVVQSNTDSFSLPSGSVLVIFSDIFGKTNNNVIAFRKSSLSFCDDEDPHWRIDATRTWLLPGGEFAFLNALLYVGPVPVMYFPVFYYPKDELIFNPVFSYKPRSGYSIQTTLYLYGRKPLEVTSTSASSTTDSTSLQAIKSIQNFFRPAVLKNQELQGLMLHNLDSNYKGNTSNYFKIIADWYANLGLMLGFDTATSPSKYITSLKTSLGIAFSNTVFQNGTSYTNFSPVTGLKYSDDSNFLGLKLPFRYSGNIDLTVSKPITLNLSVPVYSDPYYANDFLNNRSESMDWISYFIENATMTNSSSDSQTTSVTEISSFSWKLNTSYNASIPSFITPYISSFSITTNTLLNIASLENTYIKPKVTSAFYNLMNQNNRRQETWYLYTPKRKFYYPSEVTPVVANMNISGTIFQWPMPSRSVTKTDPSYLITMNRPDELKSESQIERELKLKEEQERNEKIAAGELDPETEEKETEDEKSTDGKYVPVLPSLDFTIPAAMENQGITYSLGYTLSPSITTQLSYSGMNLTQPEDFKWDRVRSFMYTITNPISISSKFNYGGNFFSVNNTVAYDSLYQGHPHVSEKYEEGGYTPYALDSLRLADYNAEKQDITNSNTISIFPFTYLPIISGTGVTWNSNIKLFRRKFKGNVDEPEWECFTVDWDNEECITANNLSVILGTTENEGKFTQSLTFTTIMPPQVRQYTASLNLGFPYVTFTASTGFTQASKTDTTWKKNPLAQSLSVSLFNSTLTLSESFNFNIENNYAESLNFSAAWKGLSLAYAMSYTTGYDFDSVTGWQARKNKEFLPYTLTFSAAPAFPTFRTWFNRITFSPTLNTSLVVDFLRPTSTYLLFTTGLIFQISKFCKITFSATSRNSVIYRYFQSMLGYPGRIPGEQNMFIDLLNSFRFDNENLRRGSGFKLKSLNFEIEHDLHDWEFKMLFKMEPRLLTKNGVTQYDFNPYITLGVVWKPMEAVKTQIKDDYGTWKVE